MAPRMDAVEIKVSLGREATPQAMDTLALDPDEGERRRIYFCDMNETSATGTAALALFSRGIILRLRAKGSDDADSTVKFRPFAPEHLLERWRAVHDVDGGELRVEGDWNGTRRVVSASLVVEQRPREVSDAASGCRGLDKLFSRDQEAFLSDHVSEALDFGALRVLGPVEAHKWEPEPRGFDRDLAVEHWTVGQLAFLELSARSDPDDAEEVQTQLERFLRDQNLGDDVVSETKTQTVLEYLSRRAARPDATTD